MTTVQAIKLVRKHITNPSGLCYVASEAVFHLSSEKLKSCVMPNPEGTKYKTHWYLLDTKNRVIDPTVHQFIRIPDYTKGKGCGFLTKQPSKRTLKFLLQIKK